MILSFHSVGFSYTQFPVFEDLSFGVEEGEFVFLVGKSGTGKSTLLQMIYMNLLPDKGLVNAAGFNSARIKPSQIPFLRRKLGIIFQDFKLLRDRKIYDNLSFVLEVIGVRGNERKKRINFALSDVGLSHRRFSYPDQLSGGEQQRVAIARAMVNEPALIIADEPTGNLDPETSSEILELFKSINSRGTAVLFATHNYDLIRQHKARIIKLHNGNAVEVKLKNKN